MYYFQIKMFTILVLQLWVNIFTFSAFFAIHLNWLWDKLFPLNMETHFLLIDLHFSSAPVDNCLLHFPLDHWSRICLIHKFIQHHLNSIFFNEQIHIHYKLCELQASSSFDKMSDAITQKPESESNDLPQRVTADLHARYKWIWKSFKGIFSVWWEVSEMLKPLGLFLREGKRIVHLKQQCPVNLFWLTETV